MDHVCVFENDGEPATEHDKGSLQDARVSPAPSADLSSFAEDLAQQVVRVEANFLRLPLFTLDNKHMRTMDGMKCEGTFRRGGKAFTFSYTVTRNSATFYPGPLARSAHFALLSLATDGGLPIGNPIAFTWRELCGRMGIQTSGQIVTALRQALTATKGLMIESRAALFSKTDNAAITTEDDDSSFVGLYDEVAFFGATRENGTKITMNEVHLSSWYLQNLNALYSGPLDYRIWRKLNEHSMIASRLYEFLFFKFYGGQDLLRFNYATLVKFIPVRTERFLSHARKQLDPAFELLRDFGILANVQWVESRGGLPQIILHRGSFLTVVGGMQGAYDLGDDDFTLDRIEDIHQPEWQLVLAFHKAWGNAAFRPTAAELTLARMLLAEHGPSIMEELLPRLIKHLKLHWHDAKTFCAVSRYLPDVLKELQTEKLRLEREQRQRTQQDEGRKEAIKQAQDRAALAAIWSSLSPAEQKDIRATVVQGQPLVLQKHPGLIERLCYSELAKRKGLSEFRS